MSLPVVAVVGATGAVGVGFLHLLERRRFPLAELRLLASPRSAGKTMQFQGRDITVAELTAESFRGVDIALFVAGDQLLKGAALNAVQIAEYLVG
jgi:aspartate-semialdehyde dehydrogenase